MLRFNTSSQTTRCGILPLADGKVQLLGTFGGLVEIDDPYGRWIFAFRRSRDEIRRCVERFVDTLPPRPMR